MGFQMNFPFAEYVIFFVFNQMYVTSLPMCKVLEQSDHFGILEKGRNFSKNEFSGDLNATLHTLCKVSGGSKGGGRQGRAPPLSAKISSFSCSFREN